MLPSKRSLAKGKKTVLMNQLGTKLGENMIACVDGDYDYLLPGRTHTSADVRHRESVRDADIRVCHGETFTATPKVCTKYA